MSTPPESPRIYHITHTENLASIVGCGSIWSDAQRIRQGLASTSVGISGIKQRRLMELKVRCHPNTRVGEYVPFYFCPRSIMLYLLHMGNHPGLNYSDGQRPIVHLEADLKEVVSWADACGQRWAFSTGNAGANYADFYASLDDLDQINWNAVRATDFRDSMIKEGKQAEFLLYDVFPWHLVRQVGVMNPAVQRQVAGVIGTASHQPGIIVRRDWYY